MPREDQRPKGRKTAYAYFVQACSQELKRKYPDANVPFAEFSKLCSTRWKSLNDQEKQEYIDLAETDKERYQTEMDNFAVSHHHGGGGGGGGHHHHHVGGAGGSRRKKAPKDRNAPKRALSAFFWFCNDERPKVKAENSDITFVQVARELGRRWNESSQDVKAKYETLAVKDKVRYEMELEAYNARLNNAAPPQQQQQQEHVDYEDEEEDQGYHQGQESSNRRRRR